ncbi:MAG: hypothetical protein ACR2LQ_11610 [Acidimicrobiales bacterium]
MDEIVERALGYPYDRPAGSFLFDARTGRATVTEATELDIAGRHAVLAIGSNAAPIRLAQKLHGFAGDPCIPVVAVELFDHDVVYAATIASYGSVPATLVASPGTQVAVHVTVLDDEQLELMNTSEISAYTLEVVARERVRSLVALPHPIWAYVASAGPVSSEGRPIALAAVRATDRIYRAMSEAVLLGRLAQQHRLDLGEFVRRLVTDRASRVDAIEVLRTSGVPSGP